MLVHLCDMCKCEIPIVKKKIFGIETEVIDKGKVVCNEWNINNFFVKKDLCKKCAEIISKTLDYELLKLKAEYNTIGGNHNEKD